MVVVTHEMMRDLNRFMYGHLVMFVSLSQEDSVKKTLFKLLGCLTGRDDEESDQEERDQDLGLHG